MSGCNRSDKIPRYVYDKRVRSYPEPMDRRTLSRKFVSSDGRRGPPRRLPETDVEGSGSPTAREETCRCETL